MEGTVVDTGLFLSAILVISVPHCTGFFSVWSLFGVSLGKSVIPLLSNNPLRELLGL